MAYRYERSGAHRFADLCGMLIVPDVEVLQLLDLGRPDSGRYGFERFPDVADKVVLQVAFSAEQPVDVAAHVLAVLAAELPKIAELERRGAVRYMLATNLLRPDWAPGADDPVQLWLEEHCPVPATCLWRADIDRRIDWAPPALGLAFPEILDRRNAIEGILVSVLNPEGRSLVDGLIAHADSTFRRTLAQSRKVFVDVPTGDGEGRAASALLADAAWRTLAGEGGSGKSSVLEYVCAVHAARLLDDRAYLADIDPVHTSTAFRVPLVIDARAYAAHLHAQPQHVPERLLESFITSELSIVNAASPPTRAAVRRALRAAPWFLALDGLDELSDPDVSEAVTTSVVRAAVSLRRAGADIQVIVAARPCVPDSVPAAERALLPALPLRPLGRAEMDTLVEQWLATHSVVGARGDEIRERLRHALRAATVEDLARNPFHLSMLLDLLLAGQPAIPDRVASLFRDHEAMTIDGDDDSLGELGERRHLVTDFTRFLAWTAHERRAHDSGLLSVVQLAGEFVDARSHAREVVEPLVAAVRRLAYFEAVSDSHLRFRSRSITEYLCAQYLLGLEPVSAEVALDSLVRGTHSLGIARFVAALWGEGDLESVVTAVEHLLRCGHGPTALRAWGLGRQMLADRVLRSRPALMTRLVQDLFDSGGVDIAAFGPFSSGTGELAVDCGRDMVRELLVHDYIHGGSDRMRDAVALVLGRDGGALLAGRFAEHTLAARGAGRTERLKSLLRAGAHESLDQGELESLVYDDQPAERQLSLRLTALLEAGSSAFSDSPRMTADLIAQLLAWGVTKSSAGSSNVAAFATVVADGKTTAAMIEGLAVARDYDSAAIAIEDIRTEFGDSWATFALATAACGIPRHSGVTAEQKSLMDAALPLCDRALAARLWRGRSAWWAEELALASTVHERMFWAAVMASWASTAAISDHRGLLDQVLNEFDVDQFLLVVAATQAAREAREVHGGRPRPGLQLPEGASARCVILLSLALGLDGLQSIDTHDLEAPIASLATRLAVIDRLDAFDTWAGAADSEALGWCELLALAHLAHAELSTAVRGRLLGTRMPPIVVEAVLAASNDYPGPVVAAAMREAR